MTAIIGRSGRGLEENWCPQLETGSEGHRRMEDNCDGGLGRAEAVVVRMLCMY